MRSLLAAIMFVLPLSAFADPAPIQIDHVWSRAAMAGQEGAVYLTITDTGAPDTLTGVTTPVATMAELHRSFNDNGVMKMRPVAAMPIEPGKPITLAPGGYHIMLMGLKQTLKEGDSFPVTLKFSKAGQVTSTAMVQKAGATMPSMDHGSMGGMGNMPMPGSGKQP
jgi:copper(I)-binding protein